LVNTNDETDCHPFFSDFFDEKKSESFLEWNDWWNLLLSQIIYVIS
jgi:hypothetical protein